MGERKRKKSLNKDFNIEKLKEVFAEIFYGKQDSTIPDLKEKLLDGYWYMIDSGKQEDSKIRHIATHTGKGGIEMYIDEARKIGLPDYMIEKSIFVYVNGEYYPLSAVNKTKVNEGK